MSPLRLETPPSADRLLVVMSDIEMGAGGPLDDFPHSDFLGQLILSYNEPPYAELPIELVFNGDTFDLLKTSYLDTYPRHISRDVALGKMTRISGAHPHFFEAVRRFLEHKGAERRVHFIVGNHDPEILFPEVQQLIRSLCGESERVLFPGLSEQFGKVIVAHGQQYDPLFELDPNELFVKYNDREVLNISWGAVALLDTLIPLQNVFHFQDRLKPKKLVLDMMPELKELILGSFWTYYTRDYWTGFFKSGDPTKKLRWKMVKEFAARMFSNDPEVEMESTLQKKIEESDDVLLYIIGHMHQPAAWSYGDRKVLQAGCFRNEYMMSEDGRSLRPIAKGYVEAFLAGDIPIVSQLVELESPPAPEGYVPESVFDILPTVRQMLEAAEATKAAQKAQEDREDAEDGEAGGG